MAITRYAGDRFTIAAGETKPTGVLDGAYLIDTGNLTQFVRRTVGGGSEWTSIAGGGGGSPGGTGKIDLPPTVDADLTPDNLEIKFEPPKGESAILSADGSINLGSKVTGVGGSITSQRDIRLVGAGSSLEANVEDGLNLYAKGDILLSSLLPKGADKYEYKSFNMKGVIYAWGDFDARIGMEHEDVTKWGSFGLQGSLVAYGAKNQPELGDPGDGDGGDIRIKAKSVNLTFDPAYLSAFTNEVEPGPFMQTLFNVH